MEPENNFEIVTKRVCDFPEPCGCYAEGYVQGKGLPGDEQFDWIQHPKGRGCQPCSAFGKVLVRMLEHMATGEEQEGHLVEFHFTAWLHGSLDSEELR